MNFESRHHEYVKNPVLGSGLLSLFFKFFIYFFHRPLTNYSCLVARLYVSFCKICIYFQQKNTDITLLSIKYLSLNHKLLLLSVAYLWSGGGEYGKWIPNEFFFFTIFHHEEIYYIMFINNLLFIKRII